MGSPYSPTCFPSRLSLGMCLGLWQGALSKCAQQTHGVKLAFPRAATSQLSWDRSAKQILSPRPGADTSYLGEERTQRPHL